MRRVDRFSRLRREGTPLVISLVLHLVVLLLLAPWLLMRTIPAQQIEIEVMLEPDASQPPRSRAENVSRLRAPEKLPGLLTKPEILPMPPRPAPVRPPEQLAQRSPAPASQPGQGQRGQAAPAPREAASMSAPRAARPAAAPSSAGTTAMARGPAPSAAVPRVTSQNSAAQPSSRAVASPSRPGEERQAGVIAIEGPASQVQSAQPEFRQASRQGGQTSVRGGSQAPDEGLARQAGSPDLAALVASRAVPQSQAGSSASRGGAVPQVTVPVTRLSGQGGVVAAETASAGLVQSAAPVSGAQAAVASRTPSPSGQSNAPAAAASSRSVSPDERGSGLLVAAAATPMSADGAVASRAPTASGRGTVAASDSGSGSRAVSPGERGSSLAAAAAPGAAGPGAVANGAGPGASVAGEGRAQQLAGSSMAASDAPATMQAAASAALAAVPSGSDGGSGQLSAHTEAPAQATREARTAPLQAQKPNGQARVIEERFTASALKVDSPNSICEIPLMFAGFDRKPIPKGLDSINATAARLPGETPPRHHPGNESPRYPMQALGSRAEGRVLVRAEIRADGQVGKLWIKQSSGVQVLDNAALDTVRGWRFTPAQRHGMAVAMWLDVPIEYKLPKE